MESTHFYRRIKKNKNEMGEACGMYGGRKIHAGFWWGDLMKIAHLEDLGVDGSNWIFKKWNGEAWTGLLWLRIGTDGGSL
jgi:hypothetical protein